MNEAWGNYYHDVPRNDVRRREPQRLSGDRIKFTEVTFVEEQTYEVTLQEILFTDYVPSMRHSAAWRGQPNTGVLSLTPATSPTTSVPI